MPEGRNRHSGLLPGSVRRIAYTKAIDGEGIFGQIHQLDHGSRIIPNAADRNNPQAKGFCRRNDILQAYPSIDRDGNCGLNTLGNNQRSADLVGCQFGLVKIGNEQDEQRRLRNPCLAGGDLSYPAFFLFALQPSARR
jgi:hypothetical protein